MKYLLKCSFLTGIQVGEVHESTGVAIATETLGRLRSPSSIIHFSYLNESSFDGSMNCPQGNRCDDWRICRKAMKFL